MKNFILLLACLFVSISTSFAQNSLPKLELKSIQGERVDLNKISSNGELVVFSFWATWCVPCINELDAINEVYSDWQNETKVELIAVSIDDSRTVSKVKPVVNGKSWDYKVLLDTNQEFKRAVNAASIPYIIIVKNNKILYKHLGYTPGSEVELFEKIKEFAQ